MPRLRDILQPHGYGYNTAMATRCRLVSCSRRSTTVITERVGRQVLATILGKGSGEPHSAMASSGNQVRCGGECATQSGRKGHQPRLMPDCFAGGPFTCASKSA